MDDQAALRAWRAGDRAAGRQLFGRWFRRLRGFFRRRLDEGADDLAQATLLAALDAADQLREDRSFRAWIFTIARRLMIDELRRSTKLVGELDPSTMRACDLSASPSRVVAARDDQRVLVDALRRIPLDDQVLLELTYWEHLTSAELAEVVGGIGASAVRTRLQRAREQLREQLATIAPGGIAPPAADDLDAWAARVHEVAYPDESPPDHP